MDNTSKNKSLDRYIVYSDNHDFIARIFDLSVVEINFDSHHELAAHPDKRYVAHVNFWLSTLVQRVESLNRVADMLWLPERFITDIELPISRYEWLNVATDAFLMRFISIADGATILASEVFELELLPERCTTANLKRKNVPEPVVNAIKRLVDSHLDLRKERNARFHHGVEREHAADDLIFRIAAISEYRGSSVVGNDIHGQQIDTAGYLREGLVELQGQFNSASRTLEKNLDALYRLLLDEFEKRFSPKFNDPKN